MIGDATGQPVDPAAPGSHEASEEARAHFPVPERLPLPRPERINRNALTVVAVVMGMLVIAAVVFMPAGRTTTSPAPTVAGADASAPTPTYLDQPDRIGPGRAFPDQAASTPRAPATSALPDPDTIASGDVTDVPLTYSVPGGASAAPDPRAAARAAREAAYEAALEAPLVAAAAGGRDVAGRPQSQGELSLTVPAPATAHRAALAAPSAAVWGRHQAFMAEASRGASRAVRTSVDPAPGPYALQEGTLIPAVLVTEINSDLPGAVLAQVARDVCDSRTQRAVLIPAGSRLVGAYEHQLAVGQDRLLVAWTRVIFPDGRSITLPGLETKDAAGAGGVRDRVDRHTRQVFGTAALLSLVGAAVQLSQPNGGYGTLGAYPSPGQVAAGAVGQQLAQVATQMLQRNMDVQPTIRIRQGMPFNVFVSADLTFPAPYVAAP